DHEQAGVDRTDTGEHVLDEAHVTRHVDERQLAARRQRRPREPEIDRESPALLLLEPVGVHAGEGVHQRRLAVVDVARGCNYVQAATALATRGSSAGSTVRRSSTVRPWCTRPITGGSDARSVSLWSPSRAMPADGISKPGSEPAPATATVSTTSPTPRAAARRRSPSTGTDAMRQNGMASPSRRRYAMAVSCS